MLHSVDDIHIGKRSAGWQFLWNANNFQYFKPNSKSLKKWLQSGEIVDEYGESFTYEQFINDEIFNFINPELLDIQKSEEKENYKTSWYFDCNKDEYINFGNTHNITVNKFGEFYISGNDIIPKSKLRFTTCDSFS